MVWIHIGLATLLWVGIVLAAMQAGAPGRLPRRLPGRPEAAPARAEASAAR